MLNQVVSALPAVPVVVAGLAILLACITTSSRTRSAHLIRVRLWHLFHSKKLASDPEIDAYLNERSNLMSYRYFENIQCRTLADAKALIRFCTEHNVPTEEIRASGVYFDHNSLDIKKDKLPGRAREFLVGLCLMAALIITLSSAISIASKGVVVSLKDTGTWIKLSPTSAQTLRNSFISSREGLLTLKTCSSEGAEKNGFIESEREALCEILADPTLPKYVSETLRPQRWMFAIIAFGGGVFAWVLMGDIRQAYAAKRMLKHLDRLVASATT